MNKYDIRYYSTEGGCQHCEPFIRCHYLTIEAETEEQAEAIFEEMTYEDMEAVPGHKIRDLDHQTEIDPHPN